MSVVHDSLQSMNVPEKKWHLRGPDGNVYGPVTLPVLCDWAAQSRIVPGNEVSADGITWAPAQSIPELKMEWAAVLPDGSTYGPFNVLAVPHLYQNGVIPSNARIENHLTGKTMNLADMLKSRNAPYSPSQAVSTEPPHEETLTTEKEKTWEHMYREEKKARLIHEAHLQETIDSLKQKLEISEDLFKKASEQAEREHQENQLLTLDTKSKEQRLKDGATRTQNEVKSLKQAIDAAEQRNELIQKSAMDNEARLHAELEQFRQGQASAATEIQSLSSMLLAEQKKVRELAEKDRSLVVELEQTRSAATRATSEAQAQAERLRKELETQQTLYAEYQRGGTEKEASMFREAQDARSLLADAEHEIAALRRNMEALTLQTQRKTKDLEEQNSQLRNIADSSSSTIDSLRKDLHLREADAISLRNTIAAKDTEIESTSARLEELEAHYEQLKKEATQQLEDTARAAEALEVEHKGHSNTRLEAEAEMERLTEQATTFKAALGEATDRCKIFEGQLGEKIRETQELTRQLSIRDEKINSQAAEFKRKQADMLAGLEDASRSLAQEKERFSIVQKQAVEKEQRLTRELEETRDRLASQKKKFEETMASEQGRESFLTTQIDQLKAAKESADTLARETIVKLADAERRTSETTSHLSSEKTEIQNSLDHLRKENESLHTYLDQSGRKLEAREKELNERINELSSQLTTEKSKVADADHRMQAEISHTTKTLTDTINKLKDESTAALKTSQQLDKQLLKTKEDNRSLTQENATIKEEVKDAVAEMNQLQRQIESLSRKIEEQEFLIKNTMSRAGGGAPAVISLGDLVRVKIHGISLYMRDKMVNIGRNDSSERKILLGVASLLLVLCLFVIFHPSKTPAATSLIKPSIPTGTKILPVDDKTAADPAPVNPGDHDPARKGKVIAWPGMNLDSDKAKVSYSDNVCTITFSKAMFSTTTNLSDDAATAIAQVAGSLKDSFSEFSLIIEGHSAGSPADAAVSALDSYALGMARADAVREILRRRHNLPVDSIFAVSAGDSDQPFPGNDAASQSKNRTVVLKIIPKNKTYQTP